MYYLTGFKPFQKREKNGSQTLIESLSSHQFLNHLNFEVLDVSWTHVDKFLERMKNTDVSGIIGFGEGKAGSIVVELVGKNIASGLDELGVSQAHAAIEDGEPFTNFSKIRIPERVEVREGRDAGDFLCNYELFHLNRLGADTTGFVHLPPQGTTPDEDYLSLIEPTVLEIIRLNFLNDR